MRGLYYDPATGRFTQEDPIGLAGGLNLYGFAGGDPVNFSDPFGLCPDDAGDDDSKECKPSIAPVLDEALDGVLNAVQQGLQQINEVIEGIPVIGGLVKGATGVAAYGTQLSDGERGRALGTAAAEAASGGLIRGGAVRALNTKVGKALFGGRGLLNANRYLRIGVGRHGGRKVFRIAGRFVEFFRKKNPHINLKDLGPL